MKLLRVGVAHHDCWGTFSTRQYPTISMTELGAVHIVREDHHGALVNSLFRITADSPQELDSYLDYLRTIHSIKQLRIIKKGGNEAAVFIQFLSPTSSYGTVLKSHAIPIGPIVQEKQLEIHTVLTDNPRHTTSVLGELEHIGEVKVLKISDFPEEHAISDLTLKQQQALLQALSHGYYSWPRRMPLKDLAATLGVKRRTFQEHLRLAEAKFMPFAIERLLKERKF